MVGALLPILGGIGSTIAKNLFPDPADELKRKELEQRFQQQVLAQSGEIERAAADIIKTEASSEHWITATWRPILMLVIIAIIANNYLFGPYLEAIFNIAIVLPLDDRLWDLLTIGVGGYVVGRSGEKIVERWRGGQG